MENVLLYGEKLLTFLVLPVLALWYKHEKQLNSLESEILRLLTVIEERDKFTQDSRSQQALAIEKLNKGIDKLNDRIDNLISKIQS